MKKILIVGGGFGGIRAALELSRLHLPDCSITLVSDRTNFEYHATLYRLATGRSPIEACIPLRDIFDKKDTNVVEDAITKVDLKNRVATGASGSRYTYDFLILALGSETAYFDIPGLEERALGFKSINEALRLKRRIHESFELCRNAKGKNAKLCAVHFVVIGGGASGVELAGELASYTKKLAKKHGIDPSLVEVDLVEASDRILPALSERVSRKIEQRLRALGVNIFPNRSVLREDDEHVAITGIDFAAKTVIWTAGVRPNRLYREIEGLALDPSGRVKVDAYLRPAGEENVFVIGDAAMTQYPGMAQTAIWHGISVAHNIDRLLRGASLVPFAPKKPIILIPVGEGWATAVIGSFVISGRPGWWLRRLFDFTVFFLHLPLRKAIRAFFSPAHCESCGACERKDD